MVNTASKWGGGAGGGRAEEQQVSTAGARVAGAEARDGSAGDWPGQERSGVWPRGWRITVLGSCRPLRAKALPLSDWDRTPSTSC